jgi:galactose oxidase
MRASQGGAVGLLAFALWSFVMTPSAEAQTVPTSEVILINRKSGECINAAATTQKQCRGLPDEEWTFEPVAGGYQIRSNSRGTCLGVTGSSTANQAAVQQEECNGAANQTWEIRASQSWSLLVAKHSGKCMEVKGASSNENAAIQQSPCVDGNHQRWTISDEPLPSLWSPIINFPIIPAAAANMYNGKLVLWSANQELQWGGKPNQTYTVIYDPATDEQSEKLISNTGHQMFCPGTTMLADGRILVNGGSTSNKTSIFDPRTNIWSTSNQMNIPRGYQGNTLLSNGQVLTLGGSWSGGVGGKSGEVWASGLGWRVLPGIPDDPFIGPDPNANLADNHLWLFAQKNGWVFHAGPTVAMHWIDTNGNGAVNDAGPRGDDAYSINGNAILFDRGRILKVGGAPSYNGGKPANDNAYVIDIRNGPTAPVTVRKLAPMVFARAFSNSVVLPNGQVVIVGGMNVGRTFTDSWAVFMAELWDPQTEKFTRLSAMQTPRNYHSVAILLLDGRVFVGAGGFCGYGTPISECPNHPDAEILTPPYLLNANGTLATRPQITSAPAMATWGATITVTTDSVVARFALVRMGAVTHTTNNDQRRIGLTINPGGDPTGGYSMTIPDNKGVTLPGDYMLFALNAAGRPSIATVIQIR